jgi:arylsulfatase A-like enzyme
MNRRKFLKAAASAAVSTYFGASISCGRRKSAQAKEAPNVILIIADDLGWKDLSCYGNRDISTPNIDRLAAEGARFTNAFGAAPSCSPSRASIITGQYPHCNGVTGLTHVRKRLMLSPFRQTLPELLSAQGYVTGFEGKWHVAPYFPTGWYGYQRRLSGILPKDFHIQSSEKAIDFISEPRNGPFYLELNYIDTHRDDAGEFHFNPEYPVDPGKISIPEYYTLPDWPEIRLEVAKYYSNLLRMDEMIGQTLEELDRRGLAENTLVCFVSDNGAPFPGNKMTLYDRGIGTPLIFRWPKKIPAGLSSGALVSAIDIMPTLLDAAGDTSPSSAQGKSLFPLMSGGGETELREAVFAEMTYHVNYLPMRAVRTRKWKYIRNYSDHPVGLDQCSHMEWARRVCELPNQRWLRPRAPEELYDVENDPHEQMNLVDEPAHKQTLREMRSLLDEHMRRTEDPFLGKAFEHIVS